MIISVPAKVNDNIAVGDGTSAEPIDIDSDGDDPGFLEKVLFYYPVKGAEGESYMTDVNKIMKKMRFSVQRIWVSFLGLRLLSGQRRSPSQPYRLIREI